MYTRGKEFYDIVAKGLASMGYVDKNGVSALTYFIQDMFADKYNAESTFAQMGFPLNPNLPIRPTYEQIEATIRRYTTGYLRGHRQRRQHKIDRWAEPENGRYPDIQA